MGSKRARRVTRRELLIRARPDRFVLAEAAVAAFTSAPAISNKRFRADIDARIDEACRRGYAKGRGLGHE